MAVDDSRLQLASRVRSMDSFTGAASIAYALSEPGLEIINLIHFKLYFVLGIGSVFF